MNTLFADTPARMGSALRRRFAGLALLALIVGAPTGAHAGGMDGYLWYSAQPPPPGYVAGVGFYAAVWPLVAQPLDGFQIGLPGTWILPDNSDDTNVPLCPQGTYARDNWPERGPTWGDVFQTIEGGLGYWAGNRFHYGPPKFSMNATTDCYDHQIASPGWGFFEGDAPLPDDLLGIAQLSNRLLVPPDGVTMEGNPSGELLGYTWMALPLTAPAAGSPPTGDQSWTVFLNTSNFKGPVAFYIPQTWSKISAGYAYDEARGLDARGGIMGGGAMEFNTVPYLEAQDSAGTTYSKVPAIQFPVDSQGRTVLVVDVAYYSAAALSDAVAAWRDGGAPSAGQFDMKDAFMPKLTAGSLSFSQAGMALGGLDAVVQPTTLDDHTFGLQWSPGYGSPLASFPEYYQQQGSTRVAVQSAQVPPETNLTDKSFPPAKTGSPYAAPSVGAWAAPGPTSGPFKAHLSDHSTVTYAWYRFVDQPSLQHLGWTSAVKDKLQALVEKLHTTWKIDGQYMAPPSRGELVALDPELIVTPPPGLEVGYVPIVTKQELTTDMPDTGGSGGAGSGGSGGAGSGGSGGAGSGGREPDAVGPGQTSGCDCAQAADGSMASWWEGLGALLLSSAWWHRRRARAASRERL